MIDDWTNSRTNRGAGRAAVMEHVSQLARRTNQCDGRASYTWDVLQVGRDESRSARANQSSGTASSKLDATRLIGRANEPRPTSWTQSTPSDFLSTKINNHQTNAISASSRVVLSVSPEVVKNKKNADKSKSGRNIHTKVIRVSGARPVT